jgi:hypothetical protein
MHAGWLQQHQPAAAAVACSSGTQNTDTELACLMCQMCLVAVMVSYSGRYQARYQTDDTALIMLYKTWAGINQIIKMQTS